MTHKSVEIVPVAAKIVSFCPQRLLKDAVDARLPSEALPIVRGGSGFADYGMMTKAVMSLVDDGLQLRLSHRKRISKECIHKRPCWLWSVLCLWFSPTL